MLIRDNGGWGLLDPTCYIRDLDEGVRARLCEGAEGSCGNPVDKKLYLIIKLDHHIRCAHS